MKLNYASLSNIDNLNILRRYLERRTIPQATPLFVIHHLIAEIKRTLTSVYETN